MLAGGFRTQIAANIAAGGAVDLSGIAEKYAGFLPASFRASIVEMCIRDRCEPYLMQMGFLTRTPRGRCATRLAYEHLGLKAPETAAPEDNGQQSLF